MRPTPAPLGLPYDPADSQEFKRNEGLDIVNAEAAYMRGATGAGVNVAVIDTGVDAGHPDLDANISPASRDIASGTADVTDDLGHGTRVSGIIAAEKNDLGTFGVAYDATLLALKASVCESTDCTFPYPYLTAAVDYANDNLAHVINMSLGADGGSDADLEVAIERAVNAGVVVVAAAGNNSATQPFYPASLAADPAYGGMMVSVVAVNDDGKIASFSNHCGAAMNGCLSAPGVSIASTRDGAADATNTASGSGTSFAAPFVSGAAALLIQLYPDAYAGDPSSVVMFMLDGANDLGAAGVDSVYGRGLLDIAGAMQVADAAIGAAALPLDAGESVPLSQSGLAPSPAFGDGVAALDLLDDGIATISLSDGSHPYRARLDDRIMPGVGASRLQTFLADDNFRLLNGALGDGLALSMALADEADPFDNGLPGEDEEDVLAMRLSARIDEKTTARLGMGIAAFDEFGVHEAGLDLFPFAAAMTSPIPVLAERGDAMGLDRAVGDAATLSIGLFGGETANLLTGESGGATSLAQVGVGYRLGAEGNLHVDAGLLTESASQLGSQGTGAFATGAGASTHYVVVGGSYPLGYGVNLTGSTTLASTEMGGAGESILSDWSTVNSNAFGLGVVARDRLVQGDRLGLLFGQPLRAYRAEATLIVPVAIGPDGTATFREARVDASPSGRELNLQLVYARPVVPGVDFSSWLLLQHQPGHDAEAKPAAAAGVRLDLAF